jgi:hypothetical protein
MEPREIDETVQARRLSIYKQNRQVVSYQPQTQYLNLHLEPLVGGCVKPAQATG